MAGSSDISMIGFDGSDNAERAITYAGRFLSAATTYVVTAWESGTLQSSRMGALSGGMQPSVNGSLECLDQELKDEADAINRRGVELAQKAGLRAEGRVVQVETTVWAALVDAADHLNVDVLVAGTRGATGFKALLHSSTASAVLKHCHRPVLIVPPECTPASADGNRGHFTATGR